MLKFIFIFSLLLLTVSLYAKDFSSEFTQNDYDKALESDNRIVFKMKSTKLGMFTSSFKGVVKKYKVSGNLNGDKISGVTVEMRGDQLDTDSSARNSKMHDLCLSVSKYPVIKIHSFSGISIAKTGEQKVGAKINIRGVDHSVKLAVSIKVDNGNYMVSGSSAVKLTELKIPDPSIAIASVDDNVNISFNLKIKK